jgi:hypothetical protein
MGTLKAIDGDRFRFGTAGAEIAFWLTLPVSPWTKIHQGGIDEVVVLVTLLYWAIMLPFSLAGMVVGLCERDRLTIDVRRRTFSRQFGLFGRKKDRGTFDDISRLRLSKLGRSFLKARQERWVVWIEWKEPGRRPYWLAERPLVAFKGLHDTEDQRWRALEDLWDLSRRLGLPALDPFEEAASGG